MADQLIKCPKDPSVQYLRSVCEEVFRKDGFRIWCRTCHYFENTAPDSKMAAE
jgi:hypothetical protein